MHKIIGLSKICNLGKKQNKTKQNKNLIFLQHYLSLKQYPKVFWLHWRKEGPEHQKIENVCHQTPKTLKISILNVCF